VSLDKLMIHFNSILIYFRANLTAQMPITKSARVKKKKQNTHKENTKSRQFISFHVIIMVMVMMIEFNFFI
jgi:hypothetical protein